MLLIVITQIIVTNDSNLGIALLTFIVAILDMLDIELYPQNLYYFIKNNICIEDRCPLWIKHLLPKLFLRVISLITHVLTVQIGKTGSINTK